MVEKVHLYFLYLLYLTSCDSTLSGLNQAWKRKYWNICRNVIL